MGGDEVVSRYAVAVGMPFVAALLVTLVLGPIVVPLLARLKLGQRVRSDGPRRHLGKAGTPTLGGVMFVAAIVVSALIFIPLAPASLTCLLVTLGFFALGFADDFTKVVRRRPLGLRARYKLLAQVALALVLSALMIGPLGLPTTLTLPGTLLSFDLGPYFVLFVVIVVLSAVNAVNITDGLDGLAAGLAAVAFLAATWLSLLVGRPVVAAFSAAVAGGCLGFLPFNRHPARVFMGDAGSLALGGALAAVTLLSGTGLYLPILGGAFVIETASVIAQVAAFRLVGRRILRMSPLHHHFELLGWSEVLVVRRFWGFGILCGGVAALLGLLAVAGGAA